MPKCEQIDLSPGQSRSTTCRARPELAKVVAHHMQVVERGMDKILQTLSERVTAARDLESLTRPLLEMLEAVHTMVDVLVGS